METQKLSTQLERKLSIDSEPRTLTKEELAKARAAAEAFTSRDGQSAGITTEEGSLRAEVGGGKCKEGEDKVAA
ncbi:hypothetical protein BT93_F3104 [Corymbia citriodora subsp. variegata]|nr:hypothetical protein BT93_F3104 [Corymbia citriodora subsp. variegata]